MEYLYTYNSAIQKKKDDGENVADNISDGNEARQGANIMKLPICYRWWRIGLQFWQAQM